MHFHCSILMGKPLLFYIKYPEEAVYKQTGVTYASLFFNCFSHGYYINFLLYNLNNKGWRHRKENNSAPLRSIAL